MTQKISQSKLTEADQMESTETQFESSSEEKSVSVHETENQSENESQRLQSEALAKALSSTLTTVIKEFDSKAQQTSTSQDQLSQSLDRLTRGNQTGFFFFFFLFFFW